VLDVRKGNLTASSIMRRTVSLPAVKAMQENNLKSLKLYEEVNHHAKYEKWKVDIKKAVEVLLTEKLFSDKGTRSHIGLEKFKCNLFYPRNKDICKFRERIKFECKMIDFVNMKKQRAIERCKGSA